MIYNEVGVPILSRKRNMLLLSHVHLSDYYYDKNNLNRDWLFCVCKLNGRP